MPPKFRDLDADTVEVAEEYDTEKGRITIESHTHPGVIPNGNPYYYIYLDDVLLEDEPWDRAPTREEIEIILEDVEWDDGDHLVNIYGWQSMVHGFLMIVDGLARIFSFGYFKARISISFLLWALRVNHENHNPIVRKSQKEAGNG